MATISPNYSEEKKINDVEARDSGVDSDNDASIRALIEAGRKILRSLAMASADSPIDHSHEIKLRTMSWQKAAWLLAGEQVCLAIMAQSWSLSYVKSTLQHAIATI